MHIKKRKFCSTCKENINFVYENLLEEVGDCSQCGYEDDEDDEEEVEEDEEEEYEGEEEAEEINREDKAKLAEMQERSQLKKMECLETAPKKANSNGTSTPEEIDFGSFLG